MDITLKYNDNELLYLIRNGSEEAYNFLFEKYKFYIVSKVASFKIKNKDDAIQEGLICLVNAINKYDEKYNKTFNRYFDSMLKNRLLDLKRMESNNYSVIMDEEIIDQFSYVNESIERFNAFNVLEIKEKIKGKLVKMEKYIYDDYFINNISPKELAYRYKMSLPAIYHTIYRIKIKIKKYVVK